MRKVLLLPTVLCLTIFSASCAMHISGLQDESGRQSLYVFDDEHEAFASAYEAVASIIDDAPIRAVSGAMRGYSVTEKNLISSADADKFAISILPGTGKNESGEEVSGYYAEVSVENETISGRLTAKKIYRAIVENFERDGTSVQVERIRLGRYKGGAFLRGGQDRVDENGDLVAAAPLGSIAGDLEKLNEVRLKGGLTQEEYDALKKRLIE